MTLGPSLAQRWPAPVGLALALADIALAVAGVALVVRLGANVLTLPRWLHDPPVYVPLSLIGLGLAALMLGRAALRRPFPRLAWIPGGLVLGVVACEYHWRQPIGPTTNAPSFKLVSFSIDFEQSWTQADAIADYLEREKPDIALLQEVSEPFFALHGARITRSFDWHEHVDEFLIAARGPRRVGLDIAKLAHRRVMPVWRLRAGGMEFDVATVHFSKLRPSRLLIYSRLREQQRQMEDVLAAVAGHRKDGLPMIVAGDFNSPPNSWLHHRRRSLLPNSAGNQRIGFGYTFNARAPLVQIDHCVGSANVRFLHCAVRDEPITDHRPLVTELSFEPTDNP